MVPFCIGEFNFWGPVLMPFAIRAVDFFINDCIFSFLVPVFIELYNRRKECSVISKLGSKSVIAIGKFAIMGSVGNAFMEKTFA